MDDWVEGAVNGLQNYYFKHKIPFDSIRIDEEELIEQKTLQHFVKLGSIGAHFSAKQ